jgi:hypothetical protein
MPDSLLCVLGMGLTGGERGQPMSSWACAGIARPAVQAIHGSPSGRSVAAMLAIVLAVPACAGSTTPGCPPQPISAVDSGER